MVTRPEVDVEESTREAVEEYADANGLQMKRAWADLVKAGLESEGFDA